MTSWRSLRYLGFDRFAVAGHDRGARVALRLALDHPAAISRLAVLDIVPTATIYDTVDRHRAMSAWRYFFLAQPFDLPERLIGQDRSFYLRWTLAEWCATEGALTDDAIAEYQRSFDALTMHVTCEDYRAGASVDLTDDAASDTTLRCPTLVLWSASGLGALHDVPAIWQDRAGELRLVPLDCGHFLAEERPDRVISALIDLFG